MDLLSGRTLRNRVGAASSEAIAVASSGILQGISIGTILFVNYVNDIVDYFDNDIVCSLYADDIKLNTYVRSVSACSRLQLAIDRLVSWVNKWQLRISINKCMVSHVGNNTGLGKHCYAFCVEEIHGRIDAYRNVLNLRVALVWNYLPANATDFKTMQAFKDSLNKIDISSQLTIKQLTAIIITIILIITVTIMCVCVYAHVYVC